MIEVSQYKPKGPAHLGTQWDPKSGVSPFLESCFDGGSTSPDASHQALFRWELSGSTGGMNANYDNKLIVIQSHSYLIGGLEHEFYFSHHIGNFIIPTDELHHFSEG